MRAWLFTIVLFLAGSLSAQTAVGQKNLFRIEHATPEILQLVQQTGVDISMVRGLGSARAWQPNGMPEIELWLSSSELNRLRDMGLNPISIPDPTREMWLHQQGLPERERDYHNYPALTSLLQAYAADFPEICRLYSIGQTVQGRELWVLKITDNPDLNEDEPEFKYISTMHGNEPLGTEMLLNLIDDLLVEYGTDTRLTDLVNGMEIHILPMMNPDGNTANTRTNANGVDLNRSFPDPYDSPSNTPIGRQPETAAVMIWTQAKDFDLSANFHTGALLINYPFDNNASGSSVYTASPDDDLFIQVSEAYSSHNLPMWNGDFFHGITNGADWYAMSGGMQDWNYVYEGGMEVTIELSDTYMPDASQLPTYWNNNRESLLSYMEWALRGIRGITTSSATGLPLSGVEVRVTNRDFATWSAAEIGDYHRILPAGAYNLSFSKPGYQTQTFNLVSVGTGAATVLNVALQPLVAAPDFALGTIAVQDGGNGRLDPGETATLVLELQNGGTTSATALQASLESGSPWVNVETGTQTLGNLLPEHSVSASFQVSVDADAPIGSTLDFNLIASSTERTETLPFGLSVGLIVEDFESGNLAYWPWVLSGTADWAVSNGAFEGDWCARSGVVGNNQTSRMALTQTFLSSGTVQFMARVSTEANYDFLKVYVDGVTQLSLSGSVGWTSYSLSVSAGAHTLLFSYEKDGSEVGGEDAVFVDFLQLPPVAPTPRPDWTLSPPELVATLSPGAETVEHVLIQNNGGAELNWAASLSLDDPARARSQPELKLSKDEFDPRSEESGRNAGGPDAFGYTWVDSRQAGGPAFAWVEINTLGTALTGADDANYGPLALGFEMPFYGTRYSSVRVCTNGFLSFTSTETAYSNVAMPGSAVPNNLIAPFWDDLNPAAGGTIYYWDDPAADRFIVEYRNVRHYSGTTTETFQVILLGDGTITLQYQTVATANNCSVGIENLTGTDGLGLNYNTAGFLVSGLAIRFTAPVLTEPWAVLSPLTGSVAAGSSTQLNVALSAADLADGTYTGTISLTSNDPDTPAVNVPLTLIVSSQVDPVENLQISVAEGQAVLDWSAVPNALGYRIYRSATGYSGWSLVGEVGTPGWTTSQLGDERAFFRVSAVR